VRSTDESLDKVRDTTFEILRKVQGKTTTEHNYLDGRNACVVAAAAYLHQPSQGAWR